MRPLHRLALLAVLLLAPRHLDAEAPGAADIAARLAEAIGAASRGHGVVVTTVEDRTGVQATGLAAGVRRHLDERLRSSADPGPFEAAVLLSSEPGRLVATARVSDGSGRLQDVVSVSVPWAVGRVGSGLGTPPDTNAAVRVAATYPTASFDGTVLDLAVLADGRVAVLLPSEVVLFRVDGEALVREAEAALHPPTLRVRALAGTLSCPGHVAPCWALTNQGAQAVLAAFGRSPEPTTADALPWPGVATGLRYRAGTDWLEGETALGPGPFLALDGPPAAAVLPDGRVQVEPEPPSAPGEAGSALAWAWPDVLVLTSPRPPGLRDALRVVRPSPQGLEELNRWTVTGAVRALAARPRSATSSLLVAALAFEGRSHLVVHDLSRP